jgi:hypothetical protein
MQNKESSIEKILSDEIKSVGGVFIKLNPAWLKGIPDRLCILPTLDGRARIAFVELKRPLGGRLSVAQKWWKLRLTALGCEWYLICTAEQARAFVRGQTLK